MKAHVDDPILVRQVLELLYQRPPVRGRAVPQGAVFTGGNLRRYVRGDGGDMVGLCRGKEVN